MDNFANHAARLYRGFPPEHERQFLARRVIATVDTHHEIINDVLAHRERMSDPDVARANDLRLQSLESGIRHMSFLEISWSDSNGTRQGSGISEAGQRHLDSAQAAYDREWRKIFGPSAQAWDKETDPVALGERGLVRAFMATRPPHFLTHCSITHG